MYESINITSRKSYYRKRKQCMNFFSKSDVSCSASVQTSTKPHHNMMNTISIASNTQMVLPAAINNCSYDIETYLSESSVNNPYLSHQNILNTVSISSNAEMVLPDVSYNIDASLSDSIVNNQDPDPSSAFNNVPIRNHVSHQLQPSSVKEAFALACILTKTPRSHVNLFLKTLRPFLPELPNDYRSLLSTPRVVLTKTCGEGLCYESDVGLELALALYEVRTEHVILDFHIDGVPLTKSSKIQLWPVVCFIRQTKQALLLRVYQGKNKPSRKEVFGEVIGQLADVLRTGVIFENSRITVAIGNFICDSPARALVLNITYHSGTYACHICYTKMEKKFFRRNGARKTVLRNNYPVDIYTERTDADFRNKSQYSVYSKETFHHSIESIEIERLPIDIPNSFPVDYMHACLLGVMKNMLEIWSITIGNFVTDLNAELISMRPYVPTEFNRKCRDVLESWKATEYRLFLLYVGPIILKPILSQQQYTHFLKLSTSIRIMCCKELIKDQLNTAEQLINSFVSNFSIVYNEPITYNIHMVSHLPSCCRKQNMVLDEFSAFEGENYLQKLVNYYDRGQDPLKQILKRLDEELNILGKPLTAEDRRNHIASKFKKLAKSLNLFESYQTPNFKVGITKNNCFVQVKKFVVKVTEIKKTQDDKPIFSGVILSVDNFFQDPLNSSVIHIYKGNLTGSTCQFTEEDIQSKYLGYAVDNFFVLVELLHSKSSIRYENQTLLLLINRFFIAC